MNLDLENYELTEEEKFSILEVFVFKTKEFRELKGYEKKVAVELRKKWHFFKKIRTEKQTIKVQSEFSKLKMFRLTEDAKKRNVMIEKAVKKRIKVRSFLNEKRNNKKNFKFRIIVRWSSRNRN